ncbi:hypothetical protein HanRHA438_Chr14g0653861 [Helianthus annuus]|nr:hypothetical protein HanRHA438_Chr14g0653861 [Helianthus annuus]
MLRVKTDEERGKYEKSIGVTRSMTLSNLQIGLPRVFQAVTVSLTCGPKGSSLFTTVRRGLRRRTM